MTAAEGMTKNVESGSLETGFGTLKHITEDHTPVVGGILVVGGNEG